MIADQDTVTSFLLAGVGNVDLRRRTNYLIVDSKTTAKAIKDAFKQFTTREDIAIVLISHYVANMIRFVVDSYNKPVPAILEIPSKDHPYDLAHDSVLSLSSLLNPWLREGIEYPFSKIPLVALIAASEEQTLVSASHSDSPLALCYL